MSWEADWRPRVGGEPGVTAHRTPDRGRGQANDDQPARHPRFASLGQGPAHHCLGKHAQSRQQRAGQPLGTFPDPRNRAFPVFSENIDAAIIFFCRPFVVPLALPRTTNVSGPCLPRHRRPPPKRRRSTFGKGRPSWRLVPAPAPNLAPESQSRPRRLNLSPTSSPGQPIRHASKRNIKKQFLSTCRFIVEQKETISAFFPFRGCFTKNRRSRHKPRERRFKLRNMLFL